MIWRGNASPAGLFNQNGWFRGGLNLGQPQGECEDGQCYVITSILDEPTSKALYAKINQAISEDSSCLASSGSEEAQARLIEKLRKVEIGTAPAGTAPLRRDEADYVQKFKACYVPGAQVPSITPGSPEMPSKTEIPLVPIGIGAGALVLLALLS